MSKGYKGRGTERLFDDTLVKVYDAESRGVITCGQASRIRRNMSIAYMMRGMAQAMIKEGEKK